MKRSVKNKPVFDFRTIKTVKDAFKKNGYESSKLPDLSMIPEKLRVQLTTCFILMVIFEAINNGWEPDFSNHNQVKYYPWPPVLSSGFGFSYTDYGYVYSDTSIGSRLCTDTSEKALYILSQFEDLWKSWLLNVNPQ